MGGLETWLFDWANLLGRGLHLITGIAWIGASFYFVWLDNHLEPPADEKQRAAGVAGELWAVHGGGFYNPQKYFNAPPVMPAHLHWFKWEAYTTWISGMFLLCLVYYGQAGSYLIDRQVAALTPLQAILAGLAFLVGGWLVYDRLCKSPLGKNERALAAVLAVLLAIAAWGLCQVFSGRGAYIHFGAMLGTIMVANVFFVIIPGQRAMVAAATAGQVPDPIHGKRGKQRSVHNTYFTLPVLFAMISNHFPMTWGAPYNWLVLIGIAVSSALIRAWFVARHNQRLRGRASPVPLVLGIVLFIVVMIALRPQAPATSTATVTPQAEFDKVRQIITARCASCHAATPTQAGFAVAPKGVRLDDPEQIVAQAQTMRTQLASRAMPLANLTNMSDDERAAVIAWIDRGMPR